MLPVSVKHCDDIYVFTVPTLGPLGSDEKDFSFVNVEVHAKMESADDRPCPEIFATGALGRLVGGLLYLPDDRARMSKADIKVAAEHSTAERLELKRTRGLT